MKLWIKVGESEPTKVDYQEGEDIDDLKKAIKAAMSPLFNHIAAADIIVRRGLEQLAYYTLLNTDILNGNTARQPFLVDTPAPAGKNVIKTLATTTFHCQHNSLLHPFHNNSSASSFPCRAHPFDSRTISCDPTISRRCTRRRRYVWDHDK